MEDIAEIRELIVRASKDRGDMLPFIVEYVHHVIAGDCNGCCISHSEEKEAAKGGVGVAVPAKKNGARSL